MQEVREKKGGTPGYGRTWKREKVWEEKLLDVKDYWRSIGSKSVFT